MMQIITEMAEPAGAASPIGNNEDRKYFAVMYDSGNLAMIIPIILCKNEMPDSP